jgi:hypothetical protein
MELTGYVPIGVALTLCSHRRKRDSPPARGQRRPDPEERFGTTDGAVRLSSRAPRPLEDGGGQSGRSLHRARRRRNWPSSLTRTKQEGSLEAP